MDGGYQCQKCLTTKQDFAWRMILQINMADSSDNNWATCFQVILSSSGVPNFKFIDRNLKESL